MQWQVFLTAGGQDVLKIKNSVAKRLRMNKYYGTEKQGRTFLKIQGTNFEICPTYFKISQTYFLLKKRPCFSGSYTGPFFALI